MPGVFWCRIETGTEWITIMPELTWLDYESQSTEELLAMADSHRIDSLLTAFAEALSEKPLTSLTQDEAVVVAVEALQHEVNNGGFHQFFTNRSHVFAPIITGSLNRIGAADAADLTAEAIAALKVSEVTPDSIRTGAEQAGVDDNLDVLDALEACDQRYYAIAGLDEKLFRFVQSHSANIRVP